MNYLFVYSFVCVNIIDSTVLFYNTLDGSNFSYRFNNKLSSILQLMVNKNACIEIPDELYKTSELKNLINKIETKNMGFIEKKVFFKDKPFSPPVLNLNSTKNDKLIFNRPKNMLENMREVTIYVNNFSSTVYNNLKTVRDAHMQSIFPKINKTNKEELDINDVFHFLDLFPDLYPINIAGGNILEYGGITKLLSNNGKYVDRFRFYIHYQDLAKFNDTRILSLLEKCYFFLLIDFPIKEKELDLAVSKINFDKHSYIFMVESVSNYKESERINRKLNLHNVNYSPFFNGRNISFFKNNIYINKSNILTFKQSINELLLKRISNPNYFGKLILDSDCRIYTSFFSKSIGHLGNFSEEKEQIVYHLIENKNSDWIVNKFMKKPCSNCLYNFLCTPISNYEKVLKKINLCTLRM